MDTALDRTIRINVHELRILTIWAGRWSERCDVPAQKAFAGILRALGGQLPDIALTLGADVRRLADGIGCEVETVSADGGERKTFTPKKPS